MRLQNGKVQKLGLERQDDDISMSSLLFCFENLKKSREQWKSMQHEVTKC